MTVAVLHQCIRLRLERVAPGHHGYHARAISLADGARLGHLGGNYILTTESP